MSKIPIKADKEIELMRKACQLTSSILDDLNDIVKPGISTEEIDVFVHQRITEAGAIPATLDYRGFPKSCCTSINEVVCHGIPSPYQRLKEGDIINVDVTSILDEYHGDSSRMYLVGGKDACKPDVLELVEITRQAMYEGIKEVAPGKNFGDIGAAIQDYIESQEDDFGIVREYTGHGLGKLFHEPPQIIHVGKRGTGPKMKPGMTFTIEPMINQGTWKTVLSRMDGWTVRTADNKLSAQWEHSVLVTEDGVEILTKSLKFDI